MVTAEQVERCQAGDEQQQDDALVNVHDQTHQRLRPEEEVLGTAYERSHTRALSVDDAEDMGLFREPIALGYPARVAHLCFGEFARVVPAPRTHRL